MYESYFGLNTEPFSVAPDPRFMYLSDVHREALRQLEIGLRGGAGFVLLTGEIGAGKTTVWRSFLEQLPPNFDVATVVNPKLGVEALLARVCEDLRVELPEGPTCDPIDALHGHLLLAHAQGRRTLIAVDEAQSLSDEVLEQLRLLTNLVTSDRKLVQVLLIGQPELLDMLERPVLEPLAQRVVARFHLPALAEDETRRYIAHRLAVAGASSPPPFDPDALARIHELCGGVPRRINVLCDRALLATWEARDPLVTVAHVDKAATEIFARPARPKRAPAETSPDAAPHLQPPLQPPPPAAAAPDGRGPWVLAAMALVAGLVLSPWVRGWLAGPPSQAGGPPLAAGPGAQAGPGAAGNAAMNPTGTSPGNATASTAANSGATPSAPALTAGPDSAPLFAAALQEPAAWRDLAAAWGATLGAGDPCAQAASQGLQCYRAKGGLASIRQLERPVLLAVADGRGRSATVLLTALGEQKATLRAAGRDFDVPLATLAFGWRGEFATLWRAPPGYPETREGRDGRDRQEATPDPAGDGAFAKWLVERLDQVGVAPQPSAADRVRAFQAAQGLAPDGVPGPQTLMRLNRATGVAEPQLARP
jgi:general secretion pathway protein A